MNLIEGYDDLEKALMQIQSLASVLLVIEPGTGLEVANGVFWSIQESAENSIKLLDLIKRQTQQTIETTEN